jgi:hypothetical protein
LLTAGAGLKWAPKSRCLDWENLSAISSPVQRLRSAEINRFFNRILMLEALSADQIRIKYMDQLLMNIGQ